MLYYIRQYLFKHHDLNQRHHVYTCHPKAISVANKDRLPWKEVHPLRTLEQDAFAFRWTKLDDINSSASVSFLL